MDSLPENSPRSVTLLKLENGATDFARIAAMLRKILARSGIQKDMKVYVDGGEVVRGFISSGLLSEITLTTIPILIGKGTALFGGTWKDVGMRLLECKSWDFGFVQMKYKLLHEA
jgi:dihydrofolate reductase